MNPGESANRTYSDYFTVIAINGFIPSLKYQVFYMYMLPFEE